MKFFYKNFHESNISLGLTAIRAREVHELMQRDYPEKYEELLVELAARETRDFVNQHHDYADLIRRKTRMLESQPESKIKISRETHDRTFLELPSKPTAAIKDAYFFSRKLGNRRKHVFSSYYDENTNCIMYPQDKKYRKLDPELTKLHEEFPCTVLPGQFSAYYHSFTADELKYLPMQKFS